jgi:hypothetical protein
MKIVYTNGAGAQSAFRLQTIGTHTNIKPSSHRISDPIIDDDDATLTTAVLKAKIDGDGYGNIEATKSGNLKVANVEDGLSIAKGDVTGTTFVHKFGQAPDFDYGDGEVAVWGGADDAGLNQMVYVWSTTAAIDTISSSNAGDTQDVKLQGLDANLELVEQTATLNGQAKVTLTTPLIRIFRGKNDNAVDFAGHIYAYEDTAISGGVPVDTTKVRMVIHEANNQTLLALYTVPIDKTAYMRDWYASTAGASKSSQYIIRLWAREYDTGTSSWKVWQLKHISSISDIGTSDKQHLYDDPEKFKGGVDLMMTAEATATGATGASISAGFDIVLVDD